MHFVVIMKKSDGEKKVVANEKLAAYDNDFHLVAGPMSYDECIYYIESSKIVGGPVISPVGPSVDIINK